MQAAEHPAEQRLQRPELVTVALSDLRHEQLASRREVHFDRTSVVAAGAALHQTEFFAPRHQRHHAVLMRLQAPMQEGESFPLTLKFDNGSTVEIVVPILGIAARGPSE